MWWTGHKLSTKETDPVRLEGSVENRSLFSW